ncbi:MAG: hypothetical protein J6M10_03675 [Clostridia bacterium]|nr:hypothetical protein [Clostridia bacterium]
MAKDQTADKTMETMEAAPEKQDRMKNMVEIYVPRYPGEDPNMWVALNGKRYMIPCGKTSKLPEPVAKLVQASMDARERAFRHIEEMEKTNNTAIASL